MIKRPDVDALMAGELGQWLQGQIAVREQAKKDTANRRYLVIGALLCASVFAIIAFGPDLITLLWFCGIAGIAGFAWAEMPKKKAIKQVKDGINTAIADALGIAYEQDCKADEAFVLTKFCKLVPSHDRAHFEDKWSGDFGDVPFSLHEAKLEERRGSGKNKRWVTVFRGLIMAVGYNRRFHGTTLLVRDNEHRGFFGGKKDHITVSGTRLDYAEMVHPDFEDAFDIYTSDQVEARHLIDPVYVERLIALERAYSGKDIGTIFHEGSLIVALKTDDLFESGSINASDDRARLEQTLDQFARLADLAAALNRDEGLPGSVSYR